MATVTVTVEDSISPLLTAVTAELLKLEGDALRETGKQFFDFSDLGAKLVRLQVDLGPTGANEIRVRLDPSDLLLGLEAALRARNPDFLILQHDNTPSVGPDSSTVSADVAGVTGAGPFDADATSSTLSGKAA